VADQRLEIAVLHVHGRRRVIAEIHAHRQPWKIEIIGIELPRTRLSLVASDHLPLVADVRIGKD